MKDLSIIIPFRDRHSHLRQTGPLLKRVGRVIVVEQCNNKPFNRGRLCNIGAKLSETEKIIIHDVDMKPTSLDYQFHGITHFAGRASQFNYKMPYPTYFGGVVGFEKALFEKVNGFSNDFWGWGGEDDDLYNRVKLKDFEINFFAKKFLSLNHKKQIDKDLHAQNVSLLESGINLDSGLSNCLEGAKINVEEINGYKWISADF
jgi:predicted glycosyltransferase involved in capsule biosynthesis